jgi:hypothetical protein
VALEKVVIMQDNLTAPRTVIGSQISGHSAVIDNVQTFEIGHVITKTTSK